MKEVIAVLFFFAPFIIMLWLIVLVLARSVYNVWKDY